MAKRRSWTDEDLVAAVKVAKSVRVVLIALKLVPAGGNYVQVQAAIKRLNLDTQHFTGMGWRKGNNAPAFSAVPLEDLLTVESSVQSFKLKRRLFLAGLKTPQCEICGWSETSADGRIPVELDHINGVHSDNRLENLRILCPNCHSLQETHRGKNKKVRLQSFTE